LALSNRHQPNYWLLQERQARDVFVGRNPSIDEVIEAEEELRRHEDFLLLHENISKLPIKYQDVITLRFF